MAVTIQTVIETAAVLSLQLCIPGTAVICTAALTMCVSLPPSCMRREHKPLRKLVTLTIHIVGLAV